jgi:alpha-glucosidase
LYIKAGSIIPMQSVIANTTEKPNEVLEIHLYKGLEDNRFLMYEDDGQTFDCEKGVYCKRLIEYKAADNQLIFREVQGNFPSKFSKASIYLHGFELADLKPTFNQKALVVETADYLFVEPISNFDPLGKPEDLSKTIQDLPSVLIVLDKGEMIIELM